ncbi:YqfQ-like protein [Salinibacillus kushneri]|uniref:YqfQ-like protein n=1 Tax=Salinibacillus kushneri TaxID=237682 RepID=A0A1I0DKK0_9BACI|nr:VrrA/YqfQ family protein [Salinibacillus kushneri]SET32683.1 YqfQ-like protein [Salinibacillus kushneri]
MAPNTGRPSPFHFPGSQRAPQQPPQGFFQQPMMPRQMGGQRGIGGMFQRLFNRSPKGNTGFGPGIGAPGMGAQNPGYFTGAGSGIEKASKALGNVQQAINVAQQAAPMIQQYGPMVKNLPTMFKMLKALNESDDDEDDNTAEGEESEETQEAYDSDSAHEQEDDLEAFLTSDDKEEHHTRRTNKQENSVSRSKIRRSTEDGRSTPKIFI